MAIYGEYVLMKHTWGVLALVMVYLLFLESSRCPVFLWWRKNVPTMRGAVVSGTDRQLRSAQRLPVRHHGLGLLPAALWAYDEKVFGVFSLVTKAIMLASIAGSIYCVWRLHQQTGWGPSVRYAVAAMIVVWTPIEIAGKWGIFRQPWLLLKPEALLVFFGGLALGTWGLWRAQRKSRALRLLAATSERGPSSTCPSVDMGAMSRVLGELGQPRARQSRRRPPRPAEPGVSGAPRRARRRWRTPARVA